MQSNSIKPHQQHLQPIRTLTTITHNRNQQKTSNAINTNQQQSKALKHNRKTIKHDRKRTITIENNQAQPDQSKNTTTTKQSNATNNNRTYSTPITSQ